MKTLNINKANEGLLVTGAEIVNKENEMTAQIFSKNSEGKYNVIVGDEEKVYSFSTLQRNWKIVDNSEEAVEETIKEEAVEETIKEEVVEETIKEEVTAENEEKSKLEIIKELNKQENIIDIQTEQENFGFEIDDLKGIPTPIASTDIYIFDNKAEKQGKVNITGHIYGVPVKADNINQTTMWKVLMELYKNRKEENDIYPLEQKQLCVKTLREIDLDTFEGAYRCLVSKTKKEYIDSLLEA